MIDYLRPERLVSRILSPKLLLTALFRAAPSIVLFACNPAKDKEKRCVCWNVQVKIGEAMYKNSSTPDQRSQRSHSCISGVLSEIPESTAIQIHNEPDHTRKP